MKKDLRDPNLKDDLKEQIKLKYKTLSKTVDFDKVLPIIYIGNIYIGKRARSICRS